mmetsp:Transcript_16439/g.34707  ORF Transcript_16439/g.34707 Transcript_16439/m.34707 type:complete len:286 (-) Transcript_16439:243-1100(-)
METHRPQLPTSDAAAMESSSSSAQSIVSAVDLIFPNSSSLSGFATPRSTPPRAQSSAFWTAGSAEASVFKSSVANGSTRADSATSLHRAVAPRMRTTRVVSESALTNVVCSCGTNGLRSAAPLDMSMDRVCRISALTPHGKRSPTMRMRGPVIWMTYGLSVVSGVRSTNSPKAAAACSRSSGEPVISPCRWIATRGPMPLGSVKAGRRVGWPRGTPMLSWCCRYSKDVSCTCCRSQVTCNAYRSFGRLFTRSSNAARPARNTAGCSAWNMPTRLCMSVGWNGERS